MKRKGDQVGKGLAHGGQVGKGLATVVIERLETGADADQRSYLKIKDPMIIISKDARRDHQG